MKTKIKKKNKCILKFEKNLNINPSCRGNYQISSFKIKKNTKAEINTIFSIDKNEKIEMDHSYQTINQLNSGEEIDDTIDLFEGLTQSDISKLIDIEEYDLLNQSDITKVVGIEESDLFNQNANKLSISNSQKSLSTFYCEDFEYCDEIQKELNDGFDFNGSSFAFDSIEEFFDDQV